MGFDAREGIVPVLIEHDYAPLFGAAFPHDESPVSVEHYGAALEAYQRTLRTPAALDRWLDGDDAALDERALEGLGLFISLGCAGCHDGPLLGGSRLQRFGLVADYFEHTGSAEPDDGLRRSTGRDEDRYLFRV